MNLDSTEAILEALNDPYTVYMSAEEYQAFLNQVDGETVVGIGVSIQNAVDDGVQILSILDNSPAQEAGLSAGDRILAVDGVTLTSGMDPTTLIRGEVGTSVTLTVRLHSTGEEKDFTLERKAVTIPIVTYDLVDGDVGYIACDSFGASTSDTVREALEATFSGLDLDGDGRITPADLEAVYAGSRAEIFRAIEAGDDEWLWEHYPVPLTTNWFRGHRRFPPNRETLPRLDLPIHILQGRWDANTPAEDALAIQETFRRLGKDNLAVHIYPDAGHALGFEQYLATGELPPALTDLFELCQGLGR